MASSRRSHLLLPTLALTLAAALAVPATARAQQAAGGGARAALVAERQRVRSDLDRANAEIDGLKRANRSLRDDYRLRARLADAEALARRLTELDARLGVSPAARATPAATDAEPRRLPSDGPAELDAKADILSDQARRLAARGEALLVRARDLKTRQNLRRRVGQMERDPFSPLEGSRRGATATGAASNGGRKPMDPGSVLVSDAKGSPASSGTSSAPQAPEGATAPPSGASLGPGRTGDGAPTGATAAPGAAPTGGFAVPGAKTAPTPTGMVGGTSDAIALSVQLRDVLDPATLAALQRLETSGVAGGGIEALERAGAALKARAERLDREAAALRASRHAPPR
jgi:hypothetical protein